ncbi:MAG: hypothetical protein ACT4O0_12340 [Pseudonocardia sp.]
MLAFALRDRHYVETGRFGAGQVELTEPFPVRFELADLVGAA